MTSDGWVDYQGLSTRSAAELKGYLAALGEVDVDRLANREEAMAFWINAYNALCIQTLIDNGLPDEVPHAVLFGKNIFTQRRYKIGGAMRTLDEIEHKILRPKYADPRVHAAIVCGAQSCPRLRPEAFEANELDRQLDEEVRSWINVETTKDGQRKNRLDEATKTLYLSRIFDWFAVDFGKGEADLLAFVRRYADEPLRKSLETSQVKVRFLPYDWSSNRQ